MGEFGDRLRREREMRGITLEEISESTKIAKRRLEALENEEFDLLPGGVFNRGFVRSYARYVGLNPDEAVADYVAAAHEQPLPEDKFPLEIPENKPKKGGPALNPRKSLLPISLAVLALVGVLAGWTAWTRHAPARQAAAKGGVTPAAQAVPSSTTVAVVPGSGPSKPAIPKTVSSPPAVAAPVVKDASKTQKALPEHQAPPHKSYTVAVVAKADSWVLIVADGKTVMEGVLDANQDRSVKFEKELVLRTGNAGGLDVSYNGKPLGVLGADNEVRTLRFPLRARKQ